MSSIINKSEVRKFALACAEEHRAAWAARGLRVSGDFLNRIEARLKNIIVAEVNAQPTKGVTIK